MLSFSTDIKNEIVKEESSKAEWIAELSAFFRTSAYMDQEVLRVTTENPAIARKIFSMMKELYDISPSVSIRKNFNFKKNNVYRLEIRKFLKMILTDLSLVNEEGYFINIPREYIISDDEEIRAYLRGLFLATGSVNDPKTSRYHLEFIVDDYDYACFIRDLLNQYELNSKVIHRVKGYMIYVKEAEKISDFLRLIKAYNAVMYFEDIRIYRDHKNMTNRLNNCEQANVEKTINTALKQIEDIQVMMKYDRVDSLDDKLKDAIQYRLQYNEASLLELSEIMSDELDYKVTKSALNHRFRKVKEIADGIRKRI